ncbi:MAG TPA: DNA polymerase III subunit delta' [Pyrinomonadaceae bacterium]|jgi:DNA polymerase-3 subunit delta'
MFKHLAGNERVKEILRRMLQSVRVPGALLLAGEEGIGKKLFALELAKALNCRTPRGVEACDECSSCKRLLRSRFSEHEDTESNRNKIIWSEHPDVGLVRPHNRIIRVVPMREIEREANFRPYEGKARIFLIEEADRLNEASANALLKTLEEPPATSHLVLITSRPASLLPTIRSRCQAIRFAPLAPADIQAHLLRTKQVSPADALLLSHVARGSIGRALETDPDSYRRRREAMLSVLDALALTNDRARLLRASEELNDAKSKDEYEPRLQVLELLIHDLWALLLGAPDEQVVNADVRPQLAQLGARLDSRRPRRWLSQIEQHRRGFDVNINRKVATDALFLAMSDA